MYLDLTPSHQILNLLDLPLDPIHTLIKILQPTPILLLDLLQQAITDNEPILRRVPPQIIDGEHPQQKHIGEVGVRAGIDSDDEVEAVDVGVGEDGHEVAHFGEDVQPRYAEQDVALVDLEDFLALGLVAVLVSVPVLYYYGQVLDREEGEEDHHDVQCDCQLELCYRVQVHN
jgi:hypothetical protein